MKTSLLVLCLFIGSACSAQRLTKVWETEPLFELPESALYDADAGVLYVSNIKGQFLAKDNNGYISKLAPDGSVVDLHWVDGLDNPQGLALYEGKLYVADIDCVVKIDVVTGVVEHTFEVEGATFINDVSVDEYEVVYFSDSQQNRVYRLCSDIVEVWSDDARLVSPNGVLCEGDSVFILLFNAGDVYRLNKQTKELVLFCSGIANADGMVSDGEGGYFATGAWQGEVFHMTAEGEKTLVLDLKGQQTTADLTYIPELRLMVIPTLDKTVLGYEWK